MNSVKPTETATVMSGKVEVRVKIEVWIRVSMRIDGLGKVEDWRGGGEVRGCEFGQGVVVTRHWSKWSLDY